MSLFPDVPDNSTYARAIDFARIFGIMVGDENGNFNPNVVITRAELCVIICNLFNFNIRKYSISSLPSKIPSWAQPYVNACIHESLLQKKWIGSPIKNATTSDLNYILYRYSVQQEHLKYILLDNPLPLLTRRPLYLTREKCAKQIFDFREEFSSKITSVLLSVNSTGKVLSEIIQLYQKFDWIRYFLSADKTLIGNVLSSYSIISSESLESLPDTIQTMQKISDLRKPFLLGAEDPNIIYHYTSLNVLNILTSHDAKFHISNTAYLNDPNEGKLVFEIALKELNHPPGEDDRIHAILASWDYFDPAFSPNFHNSEDDMYKPISINTAFIASFIPDASSLPMWYQYANKAEGCCLGFDISAHKTEFYKVQYTPDLFYTFFEELFRILYDFMEKGLGIDSEIDINNTPVFRYAKYIIQQISFLYKNPIYKHENEIRYLQIADFKSAKAETEVRNGEQLPRIYIETNIFSGADTSGLKFESIILGPKVIDPEKISVALAQRGYDPSIIKKNTIKFR